MWITSPRAEEGDFPPVTFPSAEEGSSQTPLPAVEGDQTTDQVIPVEEPIWFKLPSAGIVEPYRVTHESSSAIAGSPLRMSDLVWWSKGGTPGATPDNTSKESIRDWTVQFSGHSSATNSRAVFNGLPNVKEGDILEIGTASGVFRYAAVDTFTVAKPDFQSDPRYVLDEGNRAFVYTCYQDGKGYVTHIFAVVLELEEFVPYTTEHADNAGSDL